MDSLELNIRRIVREVSGNTQVLPDELVSRIAVTVPANFDDVTMREHVAKGISDSLSMYPEFAFLAGAIVFRNIEAMVGSENPFVSLETLNGIGLLAPGLMENIRRIPDTFSDIVSKAKKRMTPDVLMGFVDYFGAKTMAQQYLTVDHSTGKLLEDFIDLYVRVAATIHLTLNIDSASIERFEETLNAFIDKKISHASPTMFAGHQNASCFLLDMPDSISGIYGTVVDCALISQKAGGIGISASKIRARGSVIRGANGISSGIVPMLRMFNGSIKYVDQGGKRPGAAAVYLEPWHAEIFEFLELRKNGGPEDLRARDLFYALWIPDLFMQRVTENGTWSLMCPNECPGLTETYGSEFQELYEQYETEKRFRTQVPASRLWNAICSSAIETGMPYILFKDAVNRTSNQQNVSIIRSSNLCAEITEVTGPISEKPDKSPDTHIAVCNLASISLPSFVICKRLDASNPVDPVTAIDYVALKATARMLTRNLDNLITINNYPVPAAERSNVLLRPIGIGIQGLADVFHMLFLSPGSSEARAINRMITETIYLGFLEESVELAAEHGAYPMFYGSPASRGILNFDYYERDGKQVLPELWDFEPIRARIKTTGMRNSLGLALMPTASTAQILGNTESFEFPAYFFGTRRVKSGEYQVINRSLVSVLRSRGLWTKKLRDSIIINGGGLSGLATIPEDIRAVYVTAFEIPQKTVIDLAADRQAFVCQSQSMNLYLDADGSDAYRKLTKMLIYGWKRNLKTGMYYLRSRAARPVSKITVRKETVPVICTDEVCVVCSA